MMGDRESISLSDLQSGLKEAISEKYAREIWVHAEIGTLNVNASGHCFLELVEKEGLNFKAKIRATIWAFTFRILKPYFESSTGLELSAGIKVAFKVSVEYHELYGISLNIKDINPEYTVGDIELQKQKIIRRLEEEGMMDMNADLELPQVPQNIAVISSKTAAGYEDWKHHLLHNEYHYHFSFDLFEASMQGELTTDSVIRALDSIYEKEEQYDAVVLIRGGGSKLDLMSFDTYELAIHIAQFPLPVICGIGHERDSSIVDLVAHTSLKTPTAVADFLIERIRVFEESIDEMSFRLFDRVEKIMQEESHRLDILSQHFKSEARAIIANQKEKLTFLSMNIQHQAKYNCNTLNTWLENYPQKLQDNLKRSFRHRYEHLEGSQNKMINLAEQRLMMAHRNLESKARLVDAHNPKHILKRGFAMVKQGERFVKSAYELQTDHSLQIIFKDGVADLKKKS